MDTDNTLTTALREIFDKYAGVLRRTNMSWGRPGHAPDSDLEAAVQAVLCKHRPTEVDPLADALADCRDRLLYNRDWWDWWEPWGMPLACLPSTARAALDRLPRAPGRLPRAPGRAAPGGGVAGWVLPMGPDPIDPSMQVFVSPRRGAALASDARGKALLVDVWRRLASAPPVAGRTIDDIWMELSAHAEDWHGGVASYHPASCALAWHGTATNARWAVLTDVGGKVVLAWDSGTGRPSSYIGHCFAEAGAAVRAEDVPPPPLSLDELRALAAR
jgi:hypothetical protein